MSEGRWRCSHEQPQESVAPRVLAGFGAARAGSVAGSIGGCATAVRAAASVPPPASPISCARVDGQSPDLRRLREACDELVRHARAGQTFGLTSTTYVG
jgi:hypothetical protein